MEAIIFTNGTYREQAFYKYYVKTHGQAYIICADGGTNFVAKAAIVPDMIVGDMDSVAPEILLDYEEKGVLIKRAKTHKDETDTELAVMFCIEKGFDEVVIFGALGSRWDHSYGNLYLLNRLLKENIKAFVMDEVNTLFLVSDKITFGAEPGTTVSILSFTDRCAGITIKGFEYPVKDGVMEHYLPGYGISNVVTESPVSIAVKQGILLVDVVNEA